MALSYINNKEIKFGSAKPLNGVYTPGSPTREYEPLDSLGIYLNSGISLSYGVENGRYMSMSDEFAATSQGNSYSFNQLFAAQMMLGFKLHDRFIACDTEHKIIGTEPLLHKAYLAEITEKTLDYFKIKIYEDKTRTFCIRMSSSEVPTSYVDLTNSFDENGLNLTQTDRQSFLSYYRFYPLILRNLGTRVEETLGEDYYLSPSAEGLRELSRDILSKFNAFISPTEGALTSLGSTAFAYAGDINYALNYGAETTEAAVSAAEEAGAILGQIEEIQAGINQLLPEMEENLELTKQYRDEAMSTEIGTVRGDLNQLKGDLQTLDDLSTQQSVDIFDLSNKVSSKIDEAYVEGGELVLKADGEEKFRLTGFGGGGGGGGGTVTSSVLTITNTSGFISTNIPYGESCVLSFSWSSTLDGIETGNGTMTVKVNSVTKILSKDIAQGEVSLDVKDFLEENRGNRVEILVTDLYGTQRKLTFTIKTISMFLKSAFNDAMIQNGTISFLYTPVGEGSKEMHITIDGTEVLTKTSTSNNRQEIVSLPAQEHGVHTIEAWFTATLNGEKIESNRLKYTVICVETGNTTPVIALKLYDTEFKQYYTYDVRYQVWTPAQLASVTLNDGDSIVELSDVNSSEHIWSIRKDVLGSYTLSVTVGSVTVSKGITVVESGIAIHPATEGLDLYLTSKGHVPGSPLEWSYNDISCVFTGFNGASDGWKYDKDNIPVMRLNGDARITIPFQPFDKEVSVLGKTLEFEFATSDVFNYDTVVIDCLSGGRGIQATAQAVTLYSSENTLYTQYKEDEHVRMSFVISASTDKTQGNIVYCYINGIMSGAYKYSTDLFRQTEPMNIILGSSNCTTDIYNIRIYDRALTRYEIVDNWLADMQNGADLVANVESNDIYENDVVTEEKLLKRGLPCLVIEGTLPMYKGDKKTVSGRYTDPNDESKSFTYTDAQIDVQGTSSQDYPRKNYKIKFKNGFTKSNGLVTENYSINGGIPVNTFTFKADYASSEGANNVELVRLYNDVVEYKSPKQKKNPKIRQGIDGFPIAIFHGSDFIGKYNFNNDKGTSEVYGFEVGDQSWEITGNGSLRQLFKAADFNTYAEVINDFESRYPEIDDKNPGEMANADISKLKEMVAWVASTDTDVEGLEETEKTARLTKFKNEFDNYFDRDSTFFYYLFTEMFLMVDSRAKNAFPSLFLQDGKWCWLPYDMDTAIGIDNGGRLVFSYNLEDIDTIDGHNVYNGQESVMWKNLRTCFASELETYYQDRIRNNDRFSYESIEQQFEDHQSKWPVALWNEDAYFKYIDPLLQTGEDRLYMCQGSKAEQRKWWLYNRFRYIDSKYNSGTAKSSFITFRAYANNNGSNSIFELTPYADIYTRVKFDQQTASARSKRGEKTTLTINGIENPNDLVVNIYSADQLADVGDISGFLPGQVNLAAAENLQSIKVGDASPSYSNPNLTSLELGANSLLTTIDARNCTALNTPINASQCVSLKEAYFENTLIPSISIPNGAVIETLHLPASLVYLQLRNLSKLTDLQIAGYNNLQTVWIENPSAAVMDMVPGIITGLPAGANVRALGINVTVDTDTELIAFFEKLGTLRGLDADGNATLDKAAVSGTIHIDTMTYEDKVKYESLYPDFTIDVTHLMCRVRFYDESGSTLLMDPVFVEKGAAVSYTGQVPSKTDTAQYNYAFAGWSQEKNSDGSNLYEGLNQVETNLDLYAAFRATLRYYTIKFINASYSPATVLQSKSTAYGETPVYAGQTPVYNPSASDAEEWGEFTEWTPAIVPVTEEATYTAKFKSLASKTRKLLMRQMKTAESSTATVIGNYALAYNSNLTAASFPAATVVNTYAFSHCGNMETVDVSAAVEVKDYAFYYCSSLTRIELPKVTKIGDCAFSNCSELATLVIGVDNDTVCTLGGTSDIPSSVTKIYVPYALVDAYKAATNWSSFASKIQGYEQPVECISLSITADDAPYGNNTTTKIHYTAECTYSKGGVLQEGTMTFTGTGTSDPFEQNMSYTDTVQREISFTYLGQTATTTITHGVYVDRIITAETSGISDYGWIVADEKYHVDGYDVYMSDSKGKGNSKAVMKLTCIGYSELTLYIRSHAEGSYDYTIASKANVSSYPTADNHPDTLAHTRSNQQSGTALSNYTAVNYTGLTGNDTIYIVYVKDVSGDNGDDRGFVLLPQ